MRVSCCVQERVVCGAGTFKKHVECNTAATRRLEPHKKAGVFFSALQSSELLPKMGACSLRGLNLRPMAHRTIALTTEIKERTGHFCLRELTLQNKTSVAEKQIDNKCRKCNNVPYLRDGILMSHMADGA